MSGFLSRFMVVSYRYSDETIGAIFDSIVSGEYHGGNKSLLAIPKDDIEIPIGMEFAKQCVDIAKAITESERIAGSTYGFREAKFIIGLVKSIRFSKVINGDNERNVQQSDIDDFMRLSYLINEQYNEVRC